MGIASYYGKKFQSRKTASGEIFNNNLMTAAHRTLPFGTNVLVTNVNNGKSVKVKINDRGPFIKKRIIDLSRAAFAKIEDLEKGLTKVEIMVVD
jgi:rare lipoprotein A